MSRRNEEQKFSNIIYKMSKGVEDKWEDMKKIFGC